jgi:hypothetical protein
MVKISTYKYDQETSNFGKISSFVVILSKTKLAHHI